VMDFWRRRWRPRRSAGPVARRHAGVTALVLLAVTAALVVLLAVVFHLGVAAAVAGIVGILATLPSAYLAWAALPSIKPPVRGRVAGLWDPVDLGVHRVIGGGPMPKYVRRPHDELLRAVLDPAVSNSRLVVVRGGSSTGKTRAAYEAVVNRLADWQLDYPQDPGALAARLDAGIPARTVLWLGELRQYADVGGGPAVLGRLADLLTGEGHVVITTMWPEHWAAYTAAARARPGAADPVGIVGRLLERLPELADCDPTGIEPARGGVIDIPDRFTEAELATAARSDDSLLTEAAAEAARDGQEGQVTQYLAGVPDLLDRYAGPGGDPYGQAVITAAVDATRLGYVSPLPAAFLREAAVGYLTDLQRATSIESWRDTALAWAADELRGAVRALQPVPPPKGTGVAGYKVADYLDQYASRERRYARVPASTWDAILGHTPDPLDAARLADSARDRLFYGYAIPLYRHAADAGDEHAGKQLAELLAGRGDLDGLRGRADAGDRAAADQLAALPTSRGDLRKVRARTSISYRRLINLMQWATVAALANACGGNDCGGPDRPGNPDGHGNLDGPIQTLRGRADVSYRTTAERLAWLLTGLLVMMTGQDLKKLGALDLEELRAKAVAVLAGLGDPQKLFDWDLDTLRACDLGGLRAQAAAGDGYAAWALAELLADRGDLEDLRARADAGDGYAAWALAELLAHRRDLDGLRGRAAVGDQLAAGLLADLLARDGNLDGAMQILCGRADVGDKAAAKRLADLLARHGNLDGAMQILRGRADAGDGYAAWALTELVADRGDLGGLRGWAAAVERLAGHGDLDTDDPLGELVTLALQGVLAYCGDLGGLRTGADAGNADAADLLAWLLAYRGDLDGAVHILRGRADAGDRAAADQLAWLLAWLLAGLLADCGDLEELCARADAGDRAAAERLAGLLTDRGNLSALRAGADVGDRVAAERLAGLLADRGDLKELSAGADAGYQLAAALLDVLMVALAVIGDQEELRGRADAGDESAAWRLDDLLARHGDLGELRARADADDEYAAWALAELLARHGDLGELRTRADAGDESAAFQLPWLLYERGDLDGLRALAVTCGKNTDPEQLADLLAGVLIKQDRREEAERLHRFGLNPDGSTA
jgi:hypothetical protein